MSSNHHLGVTSPASGEIDHMGYLSEHIGALYLNDEYSDVVLKADGEAFHGHRVILAARSEYFRALLYGGLKESQQIEIELVDTSVTALKALLKYIYTGQMSLASLKEEEVLDILGLAHKYGFEDLESAICDYLRQTLTVINVCAIYDAARLYQLTYLTKVCKNFVDECAQDVLNSAGFLQLSHGGLVELIERDSFYAQEVDIFRAVMEWGGENAGSPCSSSSNEPGSSSPDGATGPGQGPAPLEQVLKAIRFSLMSSTELFTIVRPLHVVSSDTILDALQLQTISRDSSLPYRGILKPNVNLADQSLGAQVLQGEMRSALLDGNSFYYDMEKGYTRHAINEVGDQGIVIKLGTQAIVNHIKMLLWDKDFRSYSYYVEVAMDQRDWVRVVDHTHYYCRSWQKLYFPPRVVRYVRIVGTNNTANKVFHVVSFEIMYSTDKVKLDQGLVVPQHNVATVKESASVIEGVSRSRNALLDGNTKLYDWDSGYTCHQLGSGLILVQLGQPYLLQSMRLLLWDCDDRTYSYYVEVSVNMADWTMVADHTHRQCAGWQLITFPPTPVVFVKIVGTHNTANDVFHCVHFECPAQCDESTIQAELSRTTQPSLPPCTPSDRPQLPVTAQDELNKQQPSLLAIYRAVDIFENENDSLHSSSATNNNNDDDDD